MVRVDRRKRVRLALIEPVEDDDGGACPSSTPQTASPLVAEFPTAPKAFLCPLTLSIMVEPVLDGQGNSFERRAILKWLKENTISPISRRPLHEGMLVPNNALRELIHEYMGPAWVERKAAECGNDATDESDDEPEEPLRTVCPYRRKMSRLLKVATSRERAAAGLGLELSDEGSAAFRCEDIVVVLDVPQKVGLFHLYTRGLIRDPTEDMKERLLELNFMQGQTRGGCLSIKKHSNNTSEVVFSYNDRVDEVNLGDFRNILVNFVETSLWLRRKLQTTGASEGDGS